MSHPDPKTANSADPSEWFDTNHRNWDERVPTHLASQSYDVEGFKKGGCTLRDFDLEALPDVEGKDLVHLQCHFGLDTLSWARRGARVTGLDFSGPAIQAAREIAADIGIDARFVEANVFDARKALGDGATIDYDIVYTGLGALCWLPDLERWADEAVGLVRPGGTLFLAEFHPFTDVFADEDLSVQYPYFQGAEPMVWEDEFSYVDGAPSLKNRRCYEWFHPISEVLNVLAQCGLVLEQASEHDYTLFPRWPCLEQKEGKIFRLPEGTPSLPLIYTLRLRRPA